MRRNAATLRAIRARFTLAVLGSILLVGSMLNPIAAPQSATAATQSGTVPVVFILDASGSMVRETSPGVSRMQVAKKATIDTLNGLPSGAQVGILVFGTGTSNDDSQKAAGCTDITTLAPLGLLDTNALTPKVNAINESGFTPIGPALRKAVSMLPAGQAGNIVLVSDGVDTCAPPSSCEVASELHRDNPLLSINVVAFGVDADEAAQQQMTCIGGVGGGTAVSATNAQQLTSRLKAASTTTASATSLSAQGSRGVALGMNLDEVRSRIDGAQVSDPTTVDGVEIIYVDCEWGTIELHDKRVYAITPKDEATGTAEGVAVGTSLTDVGSVYGKAVDSGTTTDGTFDIFQVQPGSPAGYRVSYDPQTKTVKRIILCRCVPTSAISTAVADWEITFDGIGPLRLGMTLAEARAAAPTLRSRGYGEPTVPDASGQDVIYTTFSAAGTLIALTVPQGGSGSSAPSARGIRRGDSTATAANAYPGGTYHKTERPSSESAYLVADREGHLITFRITPNTIMGIEVEDAAAAYAAQKPTAASPTPTPTASAGATAGVPPEVDGKWCTRSGTPECFSFAEFFASSPEGWIDSVSAGDVPGTTYYALCAQDHLGKHSCTTAASVYLLYFAAGVRWDCSASWETGCDPDYTAEHDISKPRLVQLANHQQDTKYHDSEPMYRQ